jgi:hypothetical protein
MSAGRKIKTQSQDWGTPAKYVRAVKAFFGGHIDLDPCSNQYSIVNARTEFSLPSKDGLSESWDYPTIYVNPPYGSDFERGTTIRNWLMKCAAAHQNFDSEVLALVPVAPNTTHWKKYIFTQAQGICFLYDTRLRFLEGGKDLGKGAPMACAMIYWGYDFKRFYEIFIEHGAVVDISNLIDEEVGASRHSLKLEIA